MRAFVNGQCDAFLNAFGQSITTSTGITFTAIVEVVPVSIDTGSGGIIESTETFITYKKEDSAIAIGTEIIVNNVIYVIYHIEDDLSGMSNAYIRNKESQSFAEDY
ncbi:MAG: hypothetical protein K0S95_747 [Pantoea eucrina]|jgi:hypothetical protein|nr:hypothetical protein [Pantoea eucrina]